VSCTGSPPDACSEADELNPCHRLTPAGLPVVRLPWGTAASGLPLGPPLARFMDDRRLLAWAAQ
jgi:Asp-tRNA(Asn)/Glu-tRNA(Gln) amidotransferase A subunit family amidase